MMTFEIETLVRGSTAYVKVTHVTKTHRKRRCIKSKIPSATDKGFVIGQIVSQLIRQCIK